MRRGLSSDEISSMPINQYFELYIFDTFIEPQGPVLQDLHSAQIAHSLYMTAPGMTKKHAEKIKLKDFMFIKGTVFKSEDEIKEEQAKKDEVRNQNVMNMFSPELLAKAKRMAKGKRNG